MHTVIGTDVVATLPVVGPPPFMAARIEVPITRAIASARQDAVLSGDPESPEGQFWAATLESPVAAGEYLIVWQDIAGFAPEVFVPLHVEAA